MELAGGLDLHVGCGRQHLSWKTPGFPGKPRRKNRHLAELGKVLLRSCLARERRLSLQDPAVALEVAPLEAAPYL